LQAAEATTQQILNA